MRWTLPNGVRWMSKNSKIEWTDTTVIVDRGGRRTRLYQRTTNKPGQQLRRHMAENGKSWCRECTEWLDSSLVSQGLCRPHRNALYRANYAAGGNHAIRQRVHARKRGTQPVPVIGQQYLMERFRRLCAYCQYRNATTWNHVIPISKGGETCPGNILPACGRCNSSKRNRDLAEWLASQAFAFPEEIIDTIVLMEM